MPEDEELTAVRVDDVPRRVRHQLGIMAAEDGMSLMAYLRKVFARLTAGRFPGGGPNPPADVAGKA